MPTASASPSGSFSNVPTGAFVDPFDPEADYPSSTVLGVHQRGRVDGARPGFLTRFAFRASLTSGTFDGSEVDVQFIQPLEGLFGLGHRFRISRNVALTVEGDFGAIVLSILGIDGFDSEEAAKLGLAPDPERWESSSNDSAVGTMALYLGPAVSLEYALSPGYGLYLRPSLDWMLGIPILQNGTTSGPITEPDGFLNEKTYVARMLSIQAGMTFYSLTRHFDVGLGWRTTAYSIDGLPDLGASGFLFTLGSTS